LERGSFGAIDNAQPTLAHVATERDLVVYRARRD
jgi:hypothetical protein